MSNFIVIPSMIAFIKNKRNKKIYKENMNSYTH